MIQMTNQSTVMPCCPHCGAAPREAVIKRGAVTITADPDEVFWRDRRVPLSPTETHLFRLIAVRGRATYKAMDDALAAFGASPATRSVVMLRIRQKFVAAGGSDPFSRLGSSGVGLKLDNDPRGSAGTVIGLQMDVETIAQLAHG